MITYDLIVIGSGSGNSVITKEMDDWKIALVEEGPIGGTCLNRGCIPTKMFAYTANQAYHASHSERYGIKTKFEGADWKDIRDRIFGRIDPIEQSGREYRERPDHVDLHANRACFVGHKQLEVGGTTITSERIVLAAGAHAVIPPIDGLDGVDWHTSDTIMRIGALPERLVIVGGGFVAIEMAHVFGSLGSEVTILVRGSQLIRDQDPEISQRITTAYLDRFDLRLDTAIVSLTAGNNGLIVADLDDGRVEGDLLLLATGRHPNGASLGVDKTGVEMDARGYVMVDEHQRTNVDGIYALGDISSPSQLKHKANADARLVAHNLTHSDDLWASLLGAIPHAVFGYPEIASVGLTETEAAATDLDYVAVVHDYGSAAYGWAMEDESSVAKVIVERHSRMLLGAHIIGPQAPTLIQILIQGMQFGQTVDELARGQWWIHPALPEVVEQALLKAIDELDT